MILACQNINKAFGDHQVLKNASFHVEEYEKTAVIGINGAGKSTLLKIIMGQRTGHHRQREDHRLSGTAPGYGQQPYDL